MKIKKTKKRLKSDIIRANNKRLFTIMSAVRLHQENQEAAKRAGEMSPAMKSILASQLIDNKLVFLRKRISRSRGRSRKLC